jgi:predicted thioesterase
MTKSFKAGDRVKWDHSQGTSTGKVVRKQTSPTKIKGHKVAASRDEPQYIVESEKTGARAAHRPEELRKS